MEARKLGYKNCLWLDACFRPLKQLDPVFEHIARNGVFFFASPGIDCTDWVHEFTTLALRCSHARFSKLTAVSTFAIGLDLTSARGNEVLLKWYDMAKSKLGFLSYIPEMAPWYILAEDLHLMPYADPGFIAPHITGISDSTILYWNHP